MIDAAGRAPNSLPEMPSEKPEAPLVTTSEALLAGRRQVLIRHGAETYRLQLNRANKLILSK